jgi:hypothetical protein
MKIADLKDIISQCVNDVLFSYNGKDSGITSEVHDYTPTFHMWYGEKIKDFHGVDELVNDKFFDGKSISDLVTEIDFSFA